MLAMSVADNLVAASYDRITTGPFGSFLGIVAAGMMLVILIGHIDLSVPWTLTAAAMMATAVGGSLAVPAGLAVGLAVGLVNGVGVAYLRITILSTVISILAFRFRWLRCPDR
jgi:ribose/xylose/arabinose/galactoside ABC-type transport system permease subunit